MIEKSIKRNYFYNLTYQIFTLIVPLITAPYLSRVLGAGGIGTYSYIESVSSYFSLFATLGLTAFGQREISYVQDSREKRSIIFWETNIIKLISATVCIVFYVIFSITRQNSALYLVLIFNLLSVIVNVSWFFQGMEEFGKIVLRNIIFKIILIIYIFTFIKTPNDIILYLLGVSACEFINNFSYWISLPKYINKPAFSDLHPFRHVKTVIALFVPTIAIQIYTVLDKTMIGIITKDSLENGYYEQAIKISKMVLTVVTSLGVVMIPKIGFHYGKGDIEKVKEYMYRAYRFVWFCGIPLTFGLIAVSGNFVPWFFGSGYEKVVPLLEILSVLILVIGISNVTGVQFLIPTRRENLFALSVIIGAITNFILNTFLIYYYQSIGAAIASVIAETSITIVQIVFVRKELSPKKIIKEGIPYYIAGCVMFIVLLLIKSYFSPSIIHSFELVLIGGSIYVIVLLIIGDDFLLPSLRKMSITHKEH